MTRTDAASPACVFAQFAELDADAVIAQLRSNRRGLSREDADARLREFGFNEPSRQRSAGWVRHFLGEFIHLFALLLWCAAALAYLAGMPALSWAIVVVILINGLFSFWQEFQAERAVQSLAALLPQQVTVRRSAAILRVFGRELVPGDIILLSEGDAVAADARIISSSGLRVDLSVLTGESHPVARSALPQRADGRAAAFLPNLLLAGTTVISGRAEAIVLRTGTNTEFGKIAELTRTQDDRSSPLEKELRRVTRVVTFLALAMGAACFALGTLLGGLSVATGLVFALGMIVANVPEGLLPTLTLALALAVRRMASRKALVKRLSAVEALGATTLILTDKTGTLTENEMTVRALWAGENEYAVTGIGYEVNGSVEYAPLKDRAGEPHPLDAHELLRIAALCADAHLVRDERNTRRWRAIGDSTETAILIAANKIGIYPELLGAWPRVAELSFDSVRKRMTTIHRMDGQLTACVKGAPGEVLARASQIFCQGKPVPLDEARRAAAEDAYEQLASRGLRVLAVAERVLSPSASHEFREDQIEQDLTLVGFVAMEDPPRHEVPEALAACREAGVRVLMLTGDSALTAQAIAREIGMYRGIPRVITGAELELLKAHELDQVLSEPELLFARVSPAHKLLLVEAYQHKGEIVAVTGDGVNDAPALKRADIGVAMGEAGTDVAREAADLVLTDDNFASIVWAVREGRAVYDNVRKFVTYIFASNVAEAAPFAAFVLFGVPLPLTVMQVLAVDLGTDLLPALALGAEPPERDVMQRPPRSRRERLLNTQTLFHAYAWLGLIEATLALTAYYFAQWLGGWRPGDPLASSGVVYIAATTMTFAAIVMAQVGNLFACSGTRRFGELRAAPSRRGSDRRTSNTRWLVSAVLFELALLAALMYVPQAARVFGLMPLKIEHWALLILFAPGVFILERIRRHLTRAPIKVGDATPLGQI